MQIYHSNEYCLPSFLCQCLYLTELDDTNKKIIMINEPFHGTFVSYYNAHNKNIKNIR